MKKIKIKVGDGIHNYSQIPELKGELPKSALDAIVNELTEQAINYVNSQNVNTLYTAERSNLTYTPRPIDISNGIIEDTLNINASQITSNYQFEQVNKKLEVMDLDDQANKVAFEEYDENDNLIVRLNYSFLNMSAGTSWIDEYGFAWTKNALINITATDPDTGDVVTVASYYNITGYFTGNTSGTTYCLSDTINLNYCVSNEVNDNFSYSSSALNNYESILFTKPKTLSLSSWYFTDKANKKQNSDSNLFSLTIENKILTLRHLPESLYIRPKSDDVLYNLSNDVYISTKPVQMPSNSTGFIGNSLINTDEIDLGLELYINLSDFVNSTNTSVNAIKDILYSQNSSGDVLYDTLHEYIPSTYDNCYALEVYQYFAAVPTVNVTNNENSATSYVLDNELVTDCDCVGKIINTTRGQSYTHTTIRNDMFWDKINFSKVVTVASAFINFTHAVSYNTVSTNLKYLDNIILESQLRNINLSDIDNINSIRTPAYSSLVGTQVFNNTAAEKSNRLGSYGVHPKNLRRIYNADYKSSSDLSKSLAHVYCQTYVNGEKSIKKICHVSSVGPRNITLEYFYVPNLSLYLNTNNGEPLTNESEITGWVPAYIKSPWGIVYPEKNITSQSNYSPNVEVPFNVIAFAEERNISTAFDSNLRYEILKNMTHIELYYETDSYITYNSSSGSEETTYETVKQYFNVNYINSITSNIVATDTGQVSATYQTTIPSVISGSYSLSSVYDITNVTSTGFNSFVHNTSTNYIQLSIAYDANYTSSNYTNLPTIDVTFMPKTRYYQVDTYTDGVLTETTGVKSTSGNTYILVPDIDDDIQLSNVTPNYTVNEYGNFVFDVSTATTQAELVNISLYYTTLTQQIIWPKVEYGDYSYAWTVNESSYTENSINASTGTIEFKLMGWPTSGSISQGYDETDSSTTQTWYPYYWSLKSNAASYSINNEAKISGFTTIFNRTMASGDSLQITYYDSSDNAIARSPIVNVI